MTRHSTPTGPEHLPDHSDVGAAPRTEAGAVLTAADRAAIAAQVRQMPPLTDQQVADVCEGIVAARARWRRTDQRHENDQSRPLPDPRSTPAA